MINDTSFYIITLVLKINTLLLKSYLNTVNHFIFAYYYFPKVYSTLRDLRMIYEFVSKVCFRIYLYVTGANFRGILN